MDVPTNYAYVMAMVTSPEQAAAVGFTAVPRDLAVALSPALGGALFATGWWAVPLLAFGCLKIAYDLATWRGFRHRTGSVMVSAVITK
ncbi:MAG: hypothetical protein K9K30_10545 [Burkholderiaceae bacterium]|nr:hypothetical protein [Sulfuritalea sp.]MCF8175668.1 hypothetical protein [Burkholderiaceae bacterium]